MDKNNNEIRSTTIEQDGVGSHVVINADSLRYIKEMPDNSVDAIITDPPYFIDGMGEDWDNGKLRKKTSHASVVGSLHVGMKFDPQHGRNLEKFMYLLSVEAKRVLKPGGFYLSFSQGRLHHRMACGIEDAGFEIRDMLIWYREGQAKAFSQEHFVRKMKIPQKEKDAIIKTLDGRKTPQLKGQSEPIVLAQNPKDGTFINNWIEHGVGLIDTTKSLDGKFPGTVMDVPKPKGQERAESKHLTLKPIRLMEHLINVFTKPGDIVFDPFSGSGTTGVACVNTGRQYIGIELTDEFYNESIERIKAHINQLSCFYLKIPRNMN